MKESRVIPEDDDEHAEVEEKAAATEHERGLKVLMDITCVKLADAAGMEDESRSCCCGRASGGGGGCMGSHQVGREEGDGLCARSSPGGGFVEYVNYRKIKGLRGRVRV